MDSDANNELDDQHAIAYVLLNPSIFQVEGITVNKTFGGGDINMQAAEAERVVTLCGLSQTVRVYKGATGDFDAIRDSVTRSQFDGSDAVNFIIDRAKAPGGRLVILAIGKLTNVGLAVRKDPSIAGNVRLVWLGTNYPDPGEYNFENDTSVVKFLLRSNLEFEVAVVRYGKPSGTAAVQVSVDDIRSHMRGKGPHIPRKIPGRNGGEFECFGDYSIDLFEHVKEQYRSLYDMAAAAIVKNPQWAHKLVIPAPKFENGRWADQPSNPRQVVLWENFSRDPIVEDLFRTMNQK
ncbi:MAG TPA: nucleoside hydrolase [Bacteroidota bacterium]|nr:nucleoside hydrolase [Bacteroidota bacterium]